MALKHIKFDCRYFDGSKPCLFKRACRGCKSYEPMNKPRGEKILIIKLASMGDVLRTTAILPALKEKYPQSHISWLVDGRAEELLRDNPFIDRVVAYGSDKASALQAERFETVISLDKAAGAAACGTLIRARKKFGFGLNERGKIFPLNKEAEYAFLLGIDDHLKFRKNELTYQQLIFEICDLKYKGERYGLSVGRKEKQLAEAFFKKNRLRADSLTVGINTGSGRVFANKNLSPGKIIALIKLLREELHAQILLLGGPLERGINKHIAGKVDFKVTDSGCGHSLKEFAGIINKCSLVISGDTLGLHLAIALERPVVALFGPTCSQEIDLYGMGIKIISGIKCAPCYKNKCDKNFNCMDSIDLEEIVNSVKQLMGRRF